MADIRQRPLVLGSVTLALTLGFLELIHQTVGEWGMYAAFAIAISGGVWWVQRQTDPKPPVTALPQYVDVTLVQQALAEAEQVIGRLMLETEDETPGVAAVKPQVSLLQSQAAQIATELDRETLRLVVMGGKGAGKTSLIQQLQATWQAEAPQPVTLYEAPSFAAGMDVDLAMDAIALQQAATADLVLFLVTGDLTESELQTVRQLATQKRTLLIFNKQDQYLPEERQTIFNRMQTWSQGLLPVADVLAIATDPRPFKVRQHQDDGSVREWLEDQQPDIASLTRRLTTLLETESRHLVMASSLSNAKTLKAQAAAALNEVRRTRALPTVEKFQWITAATAFASPVPSLDVLATAAINVQMILDLGAIYQQKFSVDQAQKIVTTLGSFILKLGLVELSTRAIAGLLKTNAFTYIAGGSIQAVSAAYLTRIAGLTLIEYFHTQEPNLTLADAKPLAIDRLGRVLEQVFQKNRQVSIFQTLASQVMDRLTPKAADKPTQAAQPTRVAQPVPLPQPVPAPLAPPVAPILQTPLVLPDKTPETVPLREN